jgi:hypothetical protein
LHAHVKLPAVFAQVALAAQLSVPAMHSSMSAQLEPSLTVSV